MYRTGDVGRVVDYARYRGTLAARGMGDVPHVAGDVAGGCGGAGGADEGSGATDGGRRWVLELLGRRDAQIKVTRRCHIGGTVTRTETLLSDPGTT